MSIAITGATGFLGQHVVIKLIQHGFDVIALGRNKEIGKRLESYGATFIQADVSDVKSMASAFTNCRAIVHTAALSSPWGKRQAFYQTNVIGTKNVIEALKISSVARLVHVSTPSIYYNGKDRLQITEADPLPKRMINAYAESKLEAEKLVMRAFSQGIQTITIRPRALFGPGDTVLFPRLIRANRSIGIPIIRSVPLLSDLTYVENVADAILLCIQAPVHCLGNTYNITNGEPLFLDQLLNLLFSALDVPLKKRNLSPYLAYGFAAVMEALAKLTGKEPPLTRYGLGVLNTGMTLDISKAKNELGYIPKVSIDEGINRFTSWWNNG